MNVPILCADRVFHIGTLNAADRGNNFKESQEGHMLSVSLCPDAWESIAKIGGQPWYALSQDRELRFLDIYAALDDENLAMRIREWGVDNGLCARSAMWKKWEFDDDSDDWRYQTFRTEQEAIDELDEYNDEGGPDGRPTIEQCEMFVGTDELGVLVKNPSVTQADSMDFVCLLWCERHFPELDGVWWAEELDVMGLSAPRGGIFPSVVESLDKVAVPRFRSEEDDVTDMKRTSIRLTAQPKP